jgi:hypothetical protein
MSSHTKDAAASWALTIAAGFIAFGALTLLMESC